MLNEFASDVMATLLDISNGLPPAANEKRRIVLAFSGGIDSSALLHILSGDESKKNFSIVAAHVNHNIQSDSNRWAKHCRSVASDYDVPFLEQTIVCKPTPGESSEAWARDQRYRWFKEIIKAGDLLLTAHHQDDQLETFFLQLIRGAGPHGLGGIRSIRSFGDGFLARPMLTKSREEVRTYLVNQQIPYIEDPSNRNPDFDRNYLRAEIVPRLRARWPHVARSVSNASEVQRALADELDKRADVFLNENRSNGGGLSRADLLAVSPDDRFSIFRQWCIHSGVQLLERRHFYEIEKTIFDRVPNPTLIIEWKNAVLRFFRGELYLSQWEQTFDPSLRFAWNLRDPLKLPNGLLKTDVGHGETLDPKFRDYPIQVGFYQRVGERCHPSTRGHSQTLKKLFQEWHVPPWMRNKVPIIWIDGKIAAVVPYCIGREFVTAPGGEGLMPRFIHR